ncbi:MAG: preprotein translocase subunit SecA [Nitrospinota bacterium]|nr:preprotein translocase subunit SecA [Nitrospinota bacterium]
MLGAIVKKIFGSHNERELKRLSSYVEAVNVLEEGVAVLSDDDLKSKTPYLQERAANGEPLVSLLPEAFAVVREAGKRALGMRHFDVQILGGAALHEGRIAEMKTGEGKTLVATLPVYLNALSGKGAHVVTVNDYLARRDSEWMGKIYRFLGMSVGVVQHGLSDSERQAAYRSDITYATNNELGFDYLRDNMKFYLDDLVLRELNFAIVDEVDSILIDEARTPLIISGASEDATDKYYTINRIVPQLLKKDVYYTLDEKARSAMLTEEGVAQAEKELGVGNLYDPSEIETLHHVQQGLKAHTLFKRDVDYLISNGQVVIVDEFTGRPMPGRRWSDGLHQAIEAKEGVNIENENQTLATITFQNFFKLYNNLSGMTGTADTEASEFASTYDREVLVIPPNRKMVRLDYADVVYRTMAEKDRAIIDEIVESHEKNQPVLVGTISIEKSESLAGMLKRRGIKHNVLNAKHHEKEAEIVAQAGRRGAVTIATNMAGRGTDIILGGNPEMLTQARMEALGEEATEEDNKATLDEYIEICAEEKKDVLEAGGLHIIGTERHESRRIDNQLRGRAGRQGDPGSSRFFLSLEDDLLRIFGAEKISGLMVRLGMEEDEPIEAGVVSKSIEHAQSKVEGHNFDIRKHLLEYDDVMNKQRESIYAQRKMIMRGEELHEMLIEMALDVLDMDMEAKIPEEAVPEDWDLEGFKDALALHFSLNLKLKENNDFTIGDHKFDFETVTHAALKEEMDDIVKAAIESKKTLLGENWLDFEKHITLQIVDGHWKDHLLSIDHLKEGIGYRGYAQKNPLTEYKKESSAMYMDLLDRIRQDVVGVFCRVQVKSEEEARLERREAARRHQNQRTTEHRGEKRDQKQETVRRDGAKVGRNDPCPCGSGKKYKKCHGKG